MQPASQVDGGERMMARPVSRRVFLAATAAASVACGGVGGAPTPTPEPAGGGLKGIDDLTGPAATPGAGPRPTPAAGAPTPLSADRPDGFVAVAPRVLRSGGVEALSVALFAGDRPASGDVRAQLSKEGRVVAEAS